MPQAHEFLIVPLGPASKNVVVKSFGAARAAARAAARSAASLRAALSAAAAAMGSPLACLPARRGAGPMRCI